MRAILKIALILAAGVFSAALPSIANAETYVAMGDSYTSAPGVQPQQSTPPGKECGRSEVNYPHLVAKALALTLTDVSCGGAKTENFLVEQFPGQPPQFDALNAATEVVSLGMGGNDHNLFATLVQGCTELDFGQPNVGAPCKKAFSGFVTKTFEENKAPQEQALKEIHELAPSAKIFVVGYPEVTPTNGYCPTALPWTTGDLRWFHKMVQVRGNNDIKKGARANGAIYVNTFNPSRGHNLCEPVGTRWIEPLFGSLTGVAVHPNALGEQNDAFDVQKAMLGNGVR
jgi:GDSL-like Lipase/Acylhydrolase family